MLIFSGLCWSLLIFSDLFWSFASSSETLFHHSPAAFSFANSCHVRSRPRVDAWMDCCLDSWSIKALSAEGNKEMNGNDTSVNSTWSTQHPNTCILPHRTCTSLNVQLVQRHVTLPPEPRPMYPFFLAGPQHGGQLNLRTRCWFLPLHPNASMEETEGKRTPAKHVP